MRRFDYRTPGDPATAARLLTQGHGLAKAGGIDLLDRMKEGLERPATVVGLHRLLERSFRRMEDGAWRIGAGIRLAELADEAQRAAFPSLAAAAAHTATPQIREMATLGGNLLQRPRCWYFRSRHYPCAKKGGTVCFAQEGRHEHHALFDNEVCAVVHPSNTAPALISLDARLELLGSTGETRTVPLAAFYTPSSADPEIENHLRPGEILRAIVLPAAAAGPRAAHYELRQRQSFDWPLAMAAANWNGPDPRLVVGAVASVPRVVEAPEALRAWSERRDPEALEAAADAALQGATPLANNSWRLPLLRAAARRALLLAAGIPPEQW